jgi:predicted TIM-barrel fold metal-dependent hydrolase
MARSLDEALQLVHRVPTSLLPDPSPRELWCPIISADDHVLEPPDLFAGRVPSTMSDQTPTVVHDAEGVPYWLIDDRRFGITTGNGASGRPTTEWIQAAQKYEEFRRAVWDPAARLKDMDLNGIDASLNFCSMIWGFAGSRFSTMRDHDVGLACLQAYNEWMLDEWCGTDRDRFIPCQLPWLADPHVGAQEIRRNAERGFRAVSFSENPEGLGFPSVNSRHWDPFFAACQETGTVVNLHVGSSGNVQRPSSDSSITAQTTLFPMSGFLAMVDWVFAKIPVHFPDIKIVLSEAGVSWVPAAIERLKRAYRQVDSSDVWTRQDPDPVELLHRNFWFTSIEDPSAFRLLDLIGEDRVMLESDYPHYDSSWPDTQRMAQDQLAHLPGATIRKICFENAAHVYRHPLPPEHLVAASIVGRDRHSLNV